jgi:Glucose-regulated metallo-peptidase M90
MRTGFAHLVAAPFAVAAIIVLFFAWESDQNLAYWLIPCLLGLSFTYVFSPQINWWWYSKRPPELEPAIVQRLQNLPFYARLEEAQQLKFRQRLALTRMNTEWTLNGFPIDEMPPDLQTAIASQAVIATWNRPDGQYFFPKYEKVIAFPKSFLSPEHPYNHQSERYDGEDKCLMFSAEAVMKAFMEPTRYFNVALYEYARLLLSEDMKVPFEYPDDIWDQLEQASGMTREQVEQTIGLTGIEPGPVLIHHQAVFATE